MKTKPITPYERLRRRGFEFAVEVKHPKNYLLWEYPKSEAIEVSAIPSAIHALDVVGFDMHVVVGSGGGLEFRAVAKRPTAPWELRA